MRINIGGKLRRIIGATVAQPKQHSVVLARGSTFPLEATSLDSSRTRRNVGVPAAIHRAIHVVLVPPAADDYKSQRLLAAVIARLAVVNPAPAT